MKARNYNAQDFEPSLHSRYECSGGGAKEKSDSGCGIAIKRQGGREILGKAMQGAVPKGTPHEKSRMLEED